MSNRKGRNESCPCGSGKKFKKCCMGQFRAVPPLAWQGEDGIHVVGQGDNPSAETIEEMTAEYQKQIRNSPLLNEMVEEYGKGKAEELLKQFKVKIAP